MRELARIYCVRGYAVTSRAGLTFLHSTLTLFKQLVYNRFVMLIELSLLEYRLNKARQRFVLAMQAANSGNGDEQEFNEAQIEYITALNAVAKAIIKPVPKSKVVK